MSNSMLNLARKWRPRSFEQVVGQPVAISMLKNSLYKNHFFPVYLFSGQKGCGKTSSARIFAAATNCERLFDFQANPKEHSIPCGTCGSCQRMNENSHPDFIEIDAASHTGVDDVRALIESCSFMPLMGRKKIYLIDEAHMLSKAAFNALLKVLEEPPETVAFLLATTELHKIPETVRSRCFTLTFSSLDHAALAQHLSYLCSEEDISCDDEALALIVQETQGCARDAINVLEQVRFSSDHISLDDVRAALGSVSPLAFAHVYRAALEKNVPEVLAAFEKNNLKALSAQRVWGMLISFTRELLLQTYDIEPGPLLSSLTEEMRTALNELSSQGRLHSISQLLWTQEDIFLSTPYKHQFIEMILLQICEQVDISELKELKELLKKKTAHKAVASQPETPSVPPARHAQQSQPAPAPTQSKPQQTAPSHGSEPWSSFVSRIAQMNDPILHSIFVQAQFIAHDGSSVTVALRNKSSFFMDKISEHEQAVLSVLAESFPGARIITYESAQGTQARPTQKPPVERKIAPPPPRPVAQGAPAQQKPYQGQRSFSRQPSQKSGLPQLSRGTPLTITDENKGEWPDAHLLSTTFPGKLETVSHSV